MEEQAIWRSCVLHMVRGVARGSTAHLILSEKYTLSPAQAAPAAQYRKITDFAFNAVCP